MHPSLDIPLSSKGEMKILQSSLQALLLLPPLWLMPSCKSKIGELTCWLLKNQLKDLNIICGMLDKMFIMLNKHHLTRVLNF